MSSTLLSRCDAHGCRSRAKNETFAPPGWLFAFTDKGTTHACCRTCRRDIDERRERMKLPALTWAKED